MSSAVSGQPGTDADDDWRRQQRLKLAAGLRCLADQVEQQPQLISRAADLMSQDFMNNRAPPPEVNNLYHVMFTNHLARHKRPAAVQVTAVTSVRKLLYCLKCMFAVRRLLVSHLQAGMFERLFVAEPVGSGITLHQKIRYCVALTHPVIRRDMLLNTTVTTILVGMLSCIATIYCECCSLHCRMACCQLDLNLQ